MSKLRVKRHTKIRKKIAGTKDCPRLAVFRSSKHIYVQLIDDLSHKTLASTSDLKVKSGAGGAKSTKTEKAYEIGKQIAQKALKLKIKKIVFDRGGFLYHGRVEQLAKGAREGGLEF